MATRFSALFKQVLATEFQKRSVLTSARTFRDVWYCSRDAAGVIANEMNGHYYYDGDRLVIKGCEGTYALSLTEREFKTTEVEEVDGEEVDGEEASESLHVILDNMKADYGPPAKAEPTERERLQALVWKLHHKPDKSDADKRNLAKYESKLRKYDRDAGTSGGGN